MTITPAIASFLFIDVLAIVTFICIEVDDRIKAKKKKNMSGEKK